MLEKSTVEMIDICSQCQNFIDGESGWIASAITALIALVIRAIEKKRLKNKKD